MGWVWLLVIGAGAMGAALLFGLGRTLWSLVASALMLGAAGYALQGRPGLVGSPAAGDATAVSDSGEINALRDKMLGRFGAEGAYVVAADAMTNIGDAKAAVRVNLGGLQAMPRSLLLWINLGDALAMHDGGHVSPPALFAFQQAMRLAPRHPAPPFFLGLAYIRAGELATGRVYWARALSLTPATISYREDIRIRLAVLDQFLAMQEAAPPR